MKSALSLVLFAAAASQLAAQRYQNAVVPTYVAVPQAPPVDPLPPIEPEPQSRPELAATMRLVRDGDLFVKLSTNQLDTTFVGLLLADLDPGVVQLPGLPPLLKTDFVIASAVDVGGAVFALGPALLGFDVYLQGVVLSDSELASTPVVRLARFDSASL